MENYKILPSEFTVSEQDVDDLNNRLSTDQDNSRENGENNSETVCNVSKDNTVQMDSVKNFNYDIKHGFRRNIEVQASSKCSPKELSASESLETLKTIQVPSKFAYRNPAASVAILENKEKPLNLKSSTSHAKERHSIDIADKLTINHPDISNSEELSEDKSLSLSKQTNISVESKDEEFQTQNHKPERKQSLARSIYEKFNSLFYTIDSTEAANTKPNVQAGTQNDGNLNKETSNSSSTKLLTANKDHTLADIENNASAFKEHALDSYEDKSNEIKYDDRPNTQIDNKTYKEELNSQSHIATSEHNNSNKEVSSDKNKMPANVTSEKGIRLNGSARDQYMIESESDLPEREISERKISEESAISGQKFTSNETRRKFAKVLEKNPQILGKIVDDEHLETDKQMAGAKIEIPALRLLKLPGLKAAMKSNVLPHKLSAKNVSDSEIIQRKETHIPTVKKVLNNMLGKMRFKRDGKEIEEIIDEFSGQKVEEISSNESENLREEPEVISNKIQKSHISLSKNTLNNFHGVLKEENDNKNLNLVDETKTLSEYDKFLRTSSTLLKGQSRVKYDPELKHANSIQLMHLEKRQIEPNFFQFETQTPRATTSLPYSPDYMRQLKPRGVIKKLDSAHESNIVQHHTEKENGSLSYLEKPEIMSSGMKKSDGPEKNDNVELFENREHSDKSHLTEKKEEEESPEPERDENFEISDDLNRYERRQTDVMSKSRTQYLPNQSEVGSEIDPESIPYYSLEVAKSEKDSDSSNRSNQAVVKERKISFDGSLPQATIKMSPDTRKTDNIFSDDFQKPIMLEREDSKGYYAKARDVSPDELKRFEKLQGTTLPKSIASGKSSKRKIQDYYFDILKSTEDDKALEYLAGSKKKLSYEVSDAQEFYNDKPRAFLSDDREYNAFALRRILNNFNESRKVEKNKDEVVPKRITSFQETSPRGKMFTRTETAGIHVVNKERPDSLETLKVKVIESNGEESKVFKKISSQEKQFEEKFQDGLNFVPSYKIGESGHKISNRETDLQAMSEIVQPVVKQNDVFSKSKKKVNSLNILTNKSDNKDLKLLDELKMPLRYNKIHSSNASLMIKDEIMPSEIKEDHTPLEKQSADSFKIPSDIKGIKSISINFETAEKNIIYSDKPISVHELPKIKETKPSDLSINYSIPYSEIVRGEFSDASESSSDHTILPYGKVSSRKTLGMKQAKMPKDDLNRNKDAISSVKSLKKSSSTSVLEEVKSLLNFFRQNLPVVDSDKRSLTPIKFSDEERDVSDMNWRQSQIIPSPIPVETDPDIVKDLKSVSATTSICGVDIKTIYHFGPTLEFVEVFIDGELKAKIVKDEVHDIYCNAMRSNDLPFGANITASTIIEANGCIMRTDVSRKENKETIAVYKNDQLLCRAGNTVLK